MLEALSAPGLQPFTFALFALIGLALLELALMLIGLSSDLGIGSAEAPEIDLPPEMPDLSEAALAEITPGPDTTPDTSGDGLVPMLRVLGFGEVPAMVWLAVLAATFAGFGFALQGVANALLGRPLSAVVASMIVALPALILTKSLARGIARLLPSVESYGTSSFHNRKGVVTIGVSRQGYPAEVRYLDSFGTSHHLMAEPLDLKDEIPAGSQVLILRDRSGRPRLIKLG